MSRCTEKISFKKRWILTRGKHSSSDLIKHTLSFRKGRLSGHFLNPGGNLQQVLLYLAVHMKLTTSQIPSSFVVCGGNMPLVSYPDNFLLSGCENAVREWDYSHRLPKHDTNLTYFTRQTGCQRRGRKRCRCTRKVGEGQNKSQGAKEIACCKSFSQNYWNTGSIQNTATVVPE